MANCPHCGGAITTADGERGECSRCGGPVKPVVEEAILVEPVHDWPGVTRPRAHPASAPPPRRGRGGWSVATILLLVFGGGFVACCGLCGLAYYYVKDVDIYVDNDSAETLMVYIDDEHVDTVQPHSAKKVECKSGSKHVKVTHAAGKVVFDQTLALKNKQYVLNPDKKHRYWIRKLTARSALTDFAKGKDKRDDPKDRGSFGELLKQTLKKVEFVDGEGPWYELPRKCDYMLDEDIPKTIPASDVKYALLRIRPDDVRLLKWFQDLDRRPTPREIVQLGGCLMRMKEVADR
ncbi:MAG: TFIIB-type zinc ribbon-containing protein [Planctomycetaceae bacterium]